MVSAPPLRETIDVAGSADVARYVPTQELDRFKHPLRPHTRDEVWWVARTRHTLSLHQLTN